MGCITVDNFTEMHDKPQIFLTVVDKVIVYSLFFFMVWLHVHALLSLLRVMY